MYIRVNANPKNLGTDDCVIRACAILLFDGDWDMAYSILSSIGFKQKKTPCSNSVLNECMISRGFKRAILSDSCPDCVTFGEFAETHLNGDYLLCSGTHVAPVLAAGRLMDAWDSSDEIVAYYYYLP